MSEAWVRKHLGGVLGWRLVRELRGYPCQGIEPSEEGTLTRQSLGYSRSFGQRLTAFDNLWGAVSTYLSRAAEKLRAQCEQAHLLTVSIGQDRYDTRRLTPIQSRSACQLALPPTPSNCWLTATECWKNFMGLAAAMLKPASSLLA